MWLRTDSTDSGADSRPAAVPHGPDNAWYHAPDASLVPEEPTSPSWTTGELPPNLQLTDQNGDAVSLYQFYGQLIILDVSAEWCPPCRGYAPYMDNFYQENIDGAVVLTLIYEDVDFYSGDADAVARWVSSRNEERRSTKSG